MSPAYLNSSQLRNETSDVRCRCRKNREATPWRPFFPDNVPYSLKLSVVLRHSVFFEAFMVVRAEIGQFLSSTARPTSILLSYVKRSATYGAGAEKNRKEEVTVAIFSDTDAILCIATAAERIGSEVCYDSVSAVTVCCRCRGGAGKNYFSGNGNVFGT